MGRARVLRFVRIAVTALSQTASVLLIALWVRSYWQLDRFTCIHSAARVVKLQSLGGRSMLIVEARPPYDAAALRNHLATLEVGEDDNSFLGFYFRQGPLTTVAIVPYWFPVMTMSALTLCVSMGWLTRFSVRTLLIATTLVAVGLGLVEALS